MTSAYLERPLRSLAQAVRDRRRRGTLDLATAQALLKDWDQIELEALGYDDRSLFSDLPVRAQEAPRRASGGRR